MSDNAPPDAPRFRCPVCRARQSVRNECRRCQADLTLVARAHRRVHYLTARLQHARACGHRSREQALTAELQQLAPNR